MRNLTRICCSRLVWRNALATVVLALPALCTELLADDKPPAKPATKALDDALLDELDNELLEGAGNLKKRPDGQPKMPSETPEPAPPEGENVAAPDEGGDPLMRIGQHMRKVEELIGKRTQRTDAQQMQQRIVQELAQLIEEAQKQQSAQQQSSSKSKQSQKTGQRQKVQQPASAQGGKDSGKPAQDSSDRLGKSPDTKVDLEARRGLMKNAWGHLPAHDREQMSQNPPERFLPQYELLIERYYKRLATEQSSK